MALLRHLLLQYHVSLRYLHFPYTTLFRSLVFGAGNPNAPLDVVMLGGVCLLAAAACVGLVRDVGATARSEEHTSELQSHSDLVCRLLLEKKNEVVRREQSSGSR